MVLTHFWSKFYTKKINDSCWQLHLPKTVKKCNCLVNAMNLKNVQGLFGKTPYNCIFIFFFFSFNLAWFCYFCNSCWVKGTHYSFLLTWLYQRKACFCNSCWVKGTHYMITASYILDFINERLAFVFVIIDKLKTNSNISFFSFGKKFDQNEWTLWIIEIC